MDVDHRPDRRVRVHEHEDRAYVAIDAGVVSHGIMLEAAQAVTLAGQLLDIAGRIIERQFNQQLGGAPSGGAEPIPIRRSGGS